MVGSNPTLTLTHQMRCRGLRSSITLGVWVGKEVTRQPPRQGQPLGDEFPVNLRLRVGVTVASFGLGLGVG